MRRGWFVVIFASALIGMVGCLPSAPTPTPSTPPADPTPAPSAARPSPSSDPVTSSIVDGRFRLELELPATSFATGDAIAGTTTLSVTDGAPATIVGPAGGPMAVSFVEVNGTRRMEAGFDAACAPYRIAPDAPIRTGLQKSGGWSSDDPNAAFYESFFADPEIHLPVGAWDVTAVATFADGECGGPQHDMRTTVRIEVLP